MLRPRLLLAAASALAGCVASGDGGFVVLNNTAAGDGCKFTGGVDQPFLSSGSLALFAPGGYQLYPLMESRITAAVGQETTKTINLQGARIDLTIESADKTDMNGRITSLKPGADMIAASSPALVHFKKLVSAALPPAGSANVGFEVVPWALVAQLKSMAGLVTGDRYHAIIRANVTMYGDLGGGEVDSNPFQYPIEICNDCGATSVGACPGGGTVAGNPCNPYQDGTVTCCTGPNGELDCPI